MKRVFTSVVKAVLGGLLVLVPLYLSVLLLLKGMKSVGTLVRPFSRLLPDWLPAEQALSLLLVLTTCFLIGVALRTRAGRDTRERVERRFFGRIPGYALFRSLTQQLAGDTRQNAWKPAFAEIEQALVPAFIIEEFEDGRYTVFVPSIPTPFAGAVYILDRKRVHPLDIPFTTALKTISQWGSGAKTLVADMERAGHSTKGS
jgi:uncharacterized membrane protein